MPYYSEYLKQTGINTSLNDNECILVNYSNKKTKYYDGLYLTNYSVGDTLTLSINSKEPEDIEMLNRWSAAMGVSAAENKELNLKIQYVTNEIPNGAIQGLFGEELNLVVNPETFRKLFFKTLNVDVDVNYNYYLYTSNPEGLDQMISSLHSKYEGLTRIQSMNYSIEQESNANEVLIKEILLYSFLFLICILSIINVFNIVVSNITSRKIELAELKAIGMSKKQINKMLRSEGLFYGAVSLIIGFGIGIAILYVLYTRMVDTVLYSFTIPWSELMLVITAVFGVIFISIGYAKKQINKENISYIIKERI